MACGRKRLNDDERYSAFSRCPHLLEANKRLMNISLEANSAL